MNKTEFTCGKLPPYRWIRLWITIPIWMPRIYRQRKIPDHITTAIHPLRIPWSNNTGIHSHQRQPPYIILNSQCNPIDNRRKTIVEYSYWRFIDSCIHVNHIWTFPYKQPLGMHVPDYILFDNKLLNCKEHKLHLFQIGYKQLVCQQLAAFSNVFYRFRSLHCAYHAWQRSENTTGRTWKNPGSPNGREY